MSFRVLLEVEVKVFYASLVGYSLGIGVSFLGARYWTFKTVLTTSVHKEFTYLSKFVIVYCITGLGMSMIIAVTEPLEFLDVNIAWGVGATFAVVANFLAQKYFVFNARSDGINSQG